MKKLLLFLALILMLVFSFQTVYAQAKNENIEEVEINEYQGEKLGAIEDFRENSIKGIQEIDIDEYRLLIDGLVAEDKEYSYSELQEKNHIKKLVTLNCVTGWSVKALWEGIPLVEILDELNISEEANTLIFYAPDGYSTSLPISYIQENNIIIADKVNDVQLPPRQGFPFQLVAEQKYGYKWIRWIERIEISSNSDYEGYWESRGYSNSAEIE
ncbi:molybdopterin-dependent oxidoreductase-like protein [Halanaerobium saccharolyticum]|uniref:Molybdopterin-dependent oxidoreductase-like protein n=1 Tax=Halanaerobium saccharolyticum TaxID=43595 RepID=A0A4R7Z594_9FIRM|nr:molybdopterin-dependent oxidoreductase [Halanaerobium saccharolyticum]RAK09422.1 molybdopterin-dependent oxidoreductase-like protein [Halanaerobium saccharolyticum]TDW06279.1 molybdopterin-dependent oxidoreductase-like protein [Halanaerobium saccharolyticum]TDX61073.1 molybdopterin-dependent oxidoreductase-like protein [Halanaerobium saccharolyticum]